MNVTVDISDLLMTTQNIPGLPLLSYQQGQWQFTTLCCKHCLPSNISLQSSAGTMALWDPHSVPLTMKCDCRALSCISALLLLSLKYTGDSYGVLDISCYG